jgi:hypothetical protein
MTIDLLEAAIPGETSAFNAAWQRVFSRLRALPTAADEPEDKTAFCQLSRCRRHRRCCGSTEAAERLPPRAAGAG